MNEKTQSILTRILDIIGDYRTGRISLQRVVDSMEGSISVLDIKLSSKFNKLWYDHWGNLETILAVDIEKGKEEEILSELDILENLIKNEMGK